VLVNSVYLAVTKFPYLTQFTVNLFRFDLGLISKTKKCGLHVTDRWELSKKVSIDGAPFLLVDESWDLQNLSKAEKWPEFVTNKWEINDNLYKIMGSMMIVKLLVVT